MSTIWLFRRRRVEVPCSIEIENTNGNLLANVSIEGVEITPGDEVILHDAPARVARGDRTDMRGRATVILSGRLEQLWARITSYFEFSNLYNVGFSGERLG